jgi:hypothetical protein
VERLLNNALNPTVEQLYLQTIGKYPAKHKTAFAKMFGCLVDGLEARRFDFLGQLYQHLGVADVDKGQFFTPEEICRLMCHISIGDAQQRIQENGYLAVNDPASGSGGTLIITADVLINQGINYQQSLFCVAHDIDLTACQMSYIQLTYLAVPALIILGDALGDEVQDSWYTLQYFISGMYAKVNREPTKPHEQTQTPEQITLFN